MAAIRKLLRDEQKSSLANEIGSKIQQAGVDSALTDAEFRELALSGSTFLIRDDNETLRACAITATGCNLIAGDLRWQDTEYVGTFQHDRGAEFNTSLDSLLHQSVQQVAGLQCSQSLECTMDGNCELTMACK